MKQPFVTTHQYTILQRPTFKHVMFSLKKNKGGGRDRKVSCEHKILIAGVLVTHLASNVAN